MEKKKDCPNKLLTALMIVCVVLSVVILGIVSYDKFIKKEEKRDVAPFVPAPMENNNKEITGNGQGDGTGCMPTSYNGEKVSSVKKITLTETNQEIEVGGKSYKIKIGSGNDYGDLLVDDNFVKFTFNGEHIHVHSAYLTDKFIFFTQFGQSGASIVYAISKNGEIVPNNNEYQIGDFKIVDGYLHASGHIFCGPEGNCPDKDLLIKYIDNTLIVTEAK